MKEQSYKVKAPAVQQDANCGLLFYTKLSL